MKTLHLPVSLAIGHARLGRSNLLISPRPRATTTSACPNRTIVIAQVIPKAALLSSELSNLSTATEPSTTILRSLCISKRVRVKSRSPGTPHHRQPRRRAAVRASAAPPAANGGWLPQSPQATVAGSSANASSLSRAGAEAAEATASLSPRGAGSASSACVGLQCSAVASLPPLEPRTLPGRLLMSLVTSVPALVPTVVDAELRQLQGVAPQAAARSSEGDCDTDGGSGGNIESGNCSEFERGAVFSLLGRSSAVAFTPPRDFSGGADSRRDDDEGVRWNDETNVLHGRIWQMQRRDKNEVIQEMLYALVALRFNSTPHTPLLRALPLLRTLPSSAGTSAVAPPSLARSFTNPAAAAAAAAAATGLRRLLSAPVRAMASRHLAMVMASQLERPPRGVPTRWDGDVGAGGKPVQALPTAAASRGDGRGRAAGQAAAGATGGVGNTTLGSSRSDGPRSGSSRVTGGGRAFGPYGPGVVRSSRLRLGQVYASSITYGYFLRQVDVRMKLEGSWCASQQPIVLERLWRLSDQLIQQQQQQHMSPRVLSSSTGGAEAHSASSQLIGESTRAVQQQQTTNATEHTHTPMPNVANAPASASASSPSTLSCSASAAPQLDRALLERCWRGGDKSSSKGQEEAAAASRAHKNISSSSSAGDMVAYLRRFDPKALRRMSHVHSREALRVIERHTEALFGAPVWEEAADGSLAVRDEAVWLNMGGIERLVLEAVAFGCALRDAEDYVDSIHNICTH